MRILRTAHNILPAGLVLTACKEAFGPGMTSQSEQKNAWKILAGIAATLAAWGLLLALGAYWSPAGEHAGADRRKLLAIAAVTGLFLLAWGAAIWLGGRRMQRLRDFRREQSPPAESAGNGDQNGPMHSGDR